jgi:hypothetical protein
MTLPFGEETAFLTTESGHLIELDLKTMKEVRRVKLPDFGCDVFRMKMLTLDIEGSKTKKVFSIFHELG